MSNLGVYLNAIEADEETNYSTQTPRTLIDTLNATDADHEILERLIATASPDSSLWRLTDAPESAWPALAAAKLFRASLTNLDAYLATVGDIDESLGELLLEASVIHTNDGETEESREEEDGDLAATKPAAAVAVLNAQRAIPRPEDRVQLVRSLRLGGPLPATQITPEESNLFALLLQHEPGVPALTSANSVQVMSPVSACHETWPECDPEVLADGPEVRIQSVRTRTMT